MGHALDLFAAIDGTPLLLPALVVVALLALTVSRPLARRLGCGRGAAFLLVAGAGLLAAATMSPGVGQTYAQGECVTDVDVLGSAWLWADVQRNLLLTVPLGLGLGLLRRGRRAVPILGALVLVPAVEAVQMLVPALGRSCQASDVAANLVGLAGGFVLALVVRRITRPRRAVIVKVTSEVNADLPDPRPLASARR